MEAATVNIPMDPHEEGLAIRREVGDRWATGNALNNLGKLARTQGNYEGVCALYREARTRPARLPTRRRTWRPDYGPAPNPGTLTRPPGASERGTVT